MSNAQELQQEAQSRWVAVARAEGIDPDRYQPKPVATRLRGKMASCVLHLSGDGRDDLYFKNLFGPTARQHLNAALKAHRIAWKALDGNPQHLAPRLLTYCEDRAAYLMSKAPGQVAQSRLEHLREDPIARTEVLYRCGAWLRELHTAGTPKQRAFPGGNGFGGPRMQAATRGAGLDRVAEPHQFSKHVLTLMRLADQAQSCPEPICTSHGDFHAGNLLIAKSTVTGIDFEHSVPGPGLADIGSFLVTFGADFEADANRVPGLPVTRMAAEAFFDGYGMRPDRGLLAIYCLKASLQKWMAVPLEIRLRSPASQRRFEGFREIASHLGGS